jgi:RNA polymerase sigma factor (sigma-70 family)
LNQPELIKQLQQGDETAFKRLVEEWQDMIYNTVVSIVQDDDAADDITQEVFIQVFQSISSFKGDAKISTWLYRIAVSKALDYERKQKRKKRFAFVQRLFGDAGNVDVHPADFVHPGILLERKESAAGLFSALKKIPDTQRAAFTLHKLEGLSYQEIAAVMNTTLAGVESLMGRAKKNLQKELTAFYKNSN